ncbi:MAG: hypothetical protein CL677_02195 [Bdellovibrionaceae bacterium]|nr:hypothetical protein [Pseudobdellovibrionaceae bacterium]
MSHLHFDPEISGSIESGLFGIPTTADKSELWLLPVPWEATASYGGGAAAGPNTILNESTQLDFYIHGIENHYLKGFHWLEESSELHTLNKLTKPMAANVMDELSSKPINELSPEAIDSLKQVNKASERVNQVVYETAKQAHDQGKLFATVGGDHSCPLGAIQLLSEKYNGDFGILHIDAHFDLRDSYQGFKYSHASIIKNALDLPQPPKSLVQWGIRDYAQSEFELATEHPSIHFLLDSAYHEARSLGKTLALLCEEWIQYLPKNVYISFDIDGLMPHLCPNTGTPVPGGLEFNDALFLIRTLVKSGRRIIGFDLCEVSPDPNASGAQWDGNVGARILFQLCSWTLESQSNE